MLRFTYLNKQEKECWLPRLFDLLYENMHTIVPSGLPYEEEKRQWLANVSPALEKAPRQILLCFADVELAGYVQYYTRNELLMVEEVQLKKDYHRTFLFFRICSQLAHILPPEIEIVEAYAAKENLHSRRIMKKLGMKLMGEEESFVHFRGDAAAIKVKFTK